MEIEHIALIDGSFFQKNVSDVIKIFMINNEKSITFVTFKNGKVTKIPFHAVLHWT